MSVMYDEAEIRAHVEGELARTIRLNHPDLKVFSGARWAETAVGPETARPKLLWTVQGPSAPWSADYVIEARVQDSELLIWFGYSSAGSLWTHHLIRPAVHLNLDEIMHMSRSYPKGSQTFSLGAVLEWMLRFRKPHGEMHFPMNDYALT